MELDNRRVFEFYDKHKNINFEEVNVTMVDMLEKTLGSGDALAYPDLGQRLLANMDTLSSRVSGIHEDYARVLESKMDSLRREYADDVRGIMSTVTSDKIGPLIKEYTEILHDRTRLLINDQVTKEISTSFNGLKDIASTSNDTQTKLSNRLAEFLRKLENSSAKGSISENIICNVLYTLYPMAKIEFVGKTKESGDILLTRKDKEPILFENKNYESKNVPQDEIDKFIKDMQIQGCSGVMLSQKSQIVFKKNYEICFYGKLIGIYVHNVEYDPEKIKIAVNIIDHLKDKLTDNNEEIDSVEIDQTTMDAINTEFNIFLTNRAAHIGFIKDTCNKLVKQTENMNLPTLDLTLETRYGSNKSKDFVCEECGFMGKNLKSLASHQKACRKRQNFESSE